MPDAWTDLGTPVQSPYPAKTSFAAAADKAFGAGKWRETSDFRTAPHNAQVGGVADSHHMRGTPVAPGAYDIVVPGMDPRQVASKLKAAGWNGSEYPERDHDHTNAPESWSDLGKPVAPGPAAPSVQTRGDGSRMGPAPTPGFMNDTKRLMSDEAREGMDTMRRASKGWSPLDTAEGLGGAVQVLTSPITGAVGAGKLALERKLLPNQFLDGSQDKSARKAGGVVSSLLPVGGGEGAAAREGVALAREGARAVDGGVGKAVTPKWVGTAKEAAAKAKEVEDFKSADAMRAARVARLKKDGVLVTGGQSKGGQARRIEESLESHPLVGNAYREQQERSIHSYNRAAYNKALEPLDRGVPKDLPPGRDGVAYVNRKISQAYDQILPQVKATNDKEAVGALRDIERRAAQLPPGQQKQFKAIVDQEVRTHFGPGETMDGRTFKQVQSQLSREARGMKGDRDYNVRKTGEMLEEVLGVLQDSAERSSGRAVSARLKKVNESYAIFTRIQDASSRRPSSLGVFTPNDLLAAVKKSDTSVRRGAFARGDALLQQFADDGSAILSSKLPNSGTADRMRLTSKDGLIETGVGAVTNPMARGVLALQEAADRAALRSPRPATREIPRRELVGRRKLLRGAGYGLGAANAVNQPGQ